MEQLDPGYLRASMHQAIWRAMQEVGGVTAAAGMSATGWNQAVLDRTPPVVRGLVRELAVAVLPTRLDPETGVPPEVYVDSLVLRVRLATLDQRVAQTMGEAGRAPEGSPEFRRLAEQLMHLQRERAALKDRMA
jgi:DNA primase